MNVKFKYWLNMLAFTSIILLALVTGLKQLDFFANLGVMSLIVMAIEYFAYVVVAISAFYYAQSRRNPIYMILYVLAVIVLVVFNARPFIF